MLFPAHCSFQWHCNPWLVDLSYAGGPNVCTLMITHAPCSETPWQRTVGTRTTANCVRRKKIYMWTWILCTVQVHIQYKCIVCPCLKHMILKVCFWTLLYGSLAFILGWLVTQLAKVHSLSRKSSRKHTAFSQNETPNSTNSRNAAMSILSATHQALIHTLSRLMVN